MSEFFNQPVQDFQKLERDLQTFARGTTAFGKSVHDMTRTELYHVIKLLLDQQKDHFDPINIRAKALGRVEMIKRGEA